MLWGFHELFTHVGDLFHIADHLIVAFGLLAQPREEGLARGRLDELHIISSRVVYLSRCRETVC